jgi:carbonic anhydrase
MIKTQIRPLDFRFFRQDLLAGTVVFFVALPLCLGIALASGAPLISGIIAGVVGGLLVGALSGSHTSVTGPAAGLTTVIAAQIASLGSFEAFLVALFIAGIIQIAMGVCRVGFIAGFFPASVIKGLLAGIGVILLLKQLPHLVGWDMDAYGEMAFHQPDNETTLSEIVRMLGHFHDGALIIGVGSLAILLMWDRFTWVKNKVPGPLFVVIFGVIMNEVFKLFWGANAVGFEHLVQVPEPASIEEFLGLFHRPDWSKLADLSIFYSGLVIALVASLETLLNLEAIDKIDPERRVSPPNRELIAQGIGNTLLGLLGGIPVTSVVIRGSVNINVGAKTRISAIFHGALLALCVVLLPHWINFIPLSCLAAILMATALKLVSPKVIMSTWAQGVNQFLPFLITVTAILFTDLLVGVFIGLGASIIFILHSNLRNPLQLIEENHLSGPVIRIILASQASFLNRAELHATLAKVEPGQHVVIDASRSDYIDADILDMIRDYKEEASLARGVKVSLVGFDERHKVKNVILYEDHSTNELQKKLKPADVLQILKEGNHRVREGRRLHRDLTRQIYATSTGQYPLGVVLSCIDSRASVELIFDLGIGDMFSVRMAGHVLSPKVLGSLEFSCAVAGAKLIMVMGHTRCGAVNAAIDFYEQSQSIVSSTGCEHLGSIIQDVQSVIQKNSGVIPPKATLEREKYENFVVRQNVINCVENIKSMSATLNRLSQEGKIDIVGCIYDVKSGGVEFIDHEGVAPFLVHPHLVKHAHVEKFDKQ